MTPGPRIARVQIQWSENGAVPARAFPSLAAADAALAAAFAARPKSDSGGYSKTAFEVVWTDGERHEGRADVRAVDVRTAPEAGGILRQHLRIVATWFRDKSDTASWWSPEERARYKAWGAELLRRLDAEPALGAPRNLHHIPEDHLLPIGTTSDDLTLTLLPDPIGAVAEMEAHFAAIRPPVDGWSRPGRPFPRTTNRDVRYATNWLSLALAADMSRLRNVTGQPHGILWDRWRKIVEYVRVHLAPDADEPYRENETFWTHHVPYLAQQISIALHGAGAGPRNSAAAERVQWKIRYRGPRGGEHVTHHLAPDYLTALQSAAFSLGFWPEVQSVHRLDGDTWRAA